MTTSVIERPQKSLSSKGSSQGMQGFGETFISKLPKHIESLKIYGRKISDLEKKDAVFAQVDNIDAIQSMMREVLLHPIKCEAQFHTEQAFVALLDKDVVDAGLFKFFNGWNETHKTTSLVSAKLIMRLAADTAFIHPHKSSGYSLTMAHMYEVAKDDFGLGHKGHDGMYKYLAEAFGCDQWINPSYQVQECNEFSDFLYLIGVNSHHAPVESSEYIQSILSAMMVSISSELWNGREYNFIAQYIDKKLLKIKPSLADDDKAFKNARGYIFAHSSEIENKHGLHALAAACVYSRLYNISFDVDELKRTMLNYNSKVGKAFRALHQALTE